MNELPGHRLFCRRITLMSRLRQLSQVLRPKVMTPPERILKAQVESTETDFHSIEIIWKSLVAPANISVWTSRIAGAHSTKIDISIVCARPILSASTDTTA